MNERNHSLDLLRVVAMFMILTVHFLGWGGAVNTLTPQDMNYYIIMPIYFVAGIGNSLFFLLAGYFAGQPKAKKAIFLERKTAFYSFFLALIAVAIGLKKGDILFLLNSAFPLLHNKFWFVTAYFVLYIFSAVLYQGLEAASDKQIIAVITVLLFNNTFIYAANMTWMQGLHMFAIGYYLHRFEPFKNWEKGWIFASYVCSLTAYVGERFAVRHYGIEHTLLDTGLRYCFLCIMSVLFFEFFIRLDYRKSWPSKIAGNVIAVYLISANQAIAHPLYEQWLRVEEFCREPWFVGYYLITNALLFAGCVEIDRLVSRYNRLETSLIEKWLKIN